MAFAYCFFCIGLTSFTRPLDPELLEVLRKQFYSEGEFVSIQTRFNFAWGLIKSNEVKDQQFGIKILADLFQTTPEHRRECLYYLSIGCFKLKDYSNARKYADVLLELEPQNRQVGELRQIIEDQLAKEGMIGVAITSGVIAAAAAAIAFFVRNNHGRR